MLEQFYPRLYLNSAYEVPYGDFREKGYRGVIFDIDNTLVPHDAPADARALELFDSLRSLGFRTCLLSNNKEPRVKSFADQVESPYLYKGGKPGVRGYRAAMEKMGTDVKSTLFVGDQLFTDVYGANRAGIYSVLVKPMNPREEIQIVLKRYLEKPVLRAYERQLKKTGEKRD